LPKKIRLLGVRVSHFEEKYLQDSLFCPPASAKKEKMYQALDRIQDKFGEGCIHRAA
jgi:hypothetical protein